MVIITWMQRGAKGAAPYTVRAVVKPTTDRTAALFVKPTTERAAALFVVERAHVDATGNTGWIPASYTYTHAMAVVCAALLQLAGGAFDEYLDGRRVLGAAAKAATPLTLDLGMLDLPED